VKAARTYGKNFQTGMGANYEDEGGG